MSQTETIPEQKTPVPVFLCYRRVDGAWHAEWLYKQLSSRFEVFYDQTLGAVEDWKAVHVPRLKLARALIVVCTPGITSDLSKSGRPDWVYEELRWWRKYRKRAPILIDSTVEGERWVPAIIDRQWPDINRIPLIKEEILSAEDRAEGRRGQSVNLGKIVGR